MARRRGGFTIIELMIVVVIIGILAAVSIPAFLSHMKTAKSSEAHLQLNLLMKNAKVYYSTQSKFPQGTAAVLPGPDGAACATGKFPLTPAWAADPVWTELDFHLDDPNLFSYHYTSTALSAATAAAVGDADCDNIHVTYQLQLSVPGGTPAGIIVPPTTLD